MSKIDVTFLEATKKILDEGELYTNERRGVTRLQVPQIHLKHDFSDGIPALSLKKLEYKQVIGELIWFLRGDNHTKYLVDNGIKIWDKDALNYYNKTLKKNISLKEFRETVGSFSVGRNYSIQWRKWDNQIDQIKTLIDSMIKDINGSRLIVNSWNAKDLDRTALPPCHDFFQVIGGSAKGFYLFFHMRSWDWFLGASFNIFSYAVLGLLLQEITGKKCRGILATGNCVHLYDNQIQPAKELIERNPKEHGKSKLVLSDKLKTLCANYDGDVDKIFRNMNIEDFILEDYTCNDKMNVKMIAPKKI